MAAPGSGIRRKRKPAAATEPLESRRKRSYLAQSWFRLLIQNLFYREIGFALNQSIFQSSYPTVLVEKIISFYAK